MKPGLLPMMLLRESYEMVVFTSPEFPVGKSVVIIGASGLSVVVIGPTGKSLSVVGLSGLVMEIP